MKLEKRISNLYEKFPDLVNSDKKLILVYLRNNGYMYNEKYITVEEFMRAPAFESITRAARKVRERMNLIDNPVQEERMKKEIKFREKYMPNRQIDMFT